MKFSKFLRVYATSNDISFNACQEIDNGAGLSLQAVHKGGHRK